MAKTSAEKVADALIEGCSNLNWNVQLFIGYLLEQPPRVQRQIVLAMLAFLRQYKMNAENPHLSWRADPEVADLIEPTDLTGYDQIV